MARAHIQKAEQIPVEPGDESGDLIAVRGPFSEGDRVAIRGAERLTDGADVKMMVSQKGFDGVAASDG